MACDCKHNEDLQPIENSHVNAFIDLKGIPFLKAEYMDRRDLMTIDRDLVKSEILVDQSEAMRAVIDIKIDDIGRRADNGRLAVVGNVSKQKALIEEITANCERFGHVLDVIRPGIIMRINYQLENQTTHQVIRSMVEDLRIPTASYYMDINKDNINDNAVIVNYNDTKVSTINEFTHGRDRMIIRITSVNMFYEALTRDPKVYSCDQSMMTGEIQPLPNHFGCEADFYKYQQTMQNHHVIGMPGCEYGLYNNERYAVQNPMWNPAWSMFSRYYHFMKNGSDIILHEQEINDPNNRKVLIPCGTVQVNRAFMINPGHRLIFKFSVWKNDHVVINDTTQVAVALKIPVCDDPCIKDDHKCNCKDKDDIINPDYETIIRMLENNRRMDELQNSTINKLISSLNDIRKDIDSSCGCGNNDEMYEKLLIKLKELNDKINKLHGIEEKPPKEDGCDCDCDGCNAELLPVHLIDEIISKFD